MFGPCFAIRYFVFSFAIIFIENKELLYLSSCFFVTGCVL